MIGADTPAGKTDILITYTYRLAFETGQGADFGLASTVTILIFIITAIITQVNFGFTGALEDVKGND
jgi:ABC-type sugar transport system permease subunit